MGWDDYIEEEFEDEDDLTEEELDELTTTSPFPPELVDWFLKGIKKWVS